MSLQVIRPVYKKTALIRYLLNAVLFSSARPRSKKVIHLGYRLNSKESQKSSFHDSLSSGNLIRPMKTF